MTEEIKLTRVSKYWALPADPLTSVICDAGLRQYVDLPARCRTIDLVFTDRPCAESFLIVPNSAGGFTLRGVRAYLLFAFQDALYGPHSRGYSYVHVEYNTR